MPKERREETLGKRLFKSVERSAGEKQGFYFQKRSRTIAHKGKLLAQVVAKSFDNFEVQWVQERLDALGLDKATILADFHSPTGHAPNVQWVVCRLLCAGMRATQRLSIMA